VVLDVLSEGSDLMMAVASWVFGGSVVDLPVELLEILNGVDDTR
jgi:hypothetical protein